MDARDELIFTVRFALSKLMPKRPRQTPPEREAEVRAIAVKVVEHLERSRYYVRQASAGARAFLAAARGAGR